MTDTTLDERFTGLVPDTVLPDQYFGAMRQNAQLDGERRLMLPLLEDAVNVFKKQVLATDPKARQLFVEAEEWITHDDPSWFFSFTNVCDTLDLDPEYIRNGLLRYKEKALAAHAKREPQDDAGEEHRSRDGETALRRRHGSPEGERGLSAVAGATTRERQGAERPAAFFSSAGAAARRRRPACPHRRVARDESRAAASPAAAAVHKCAPDRAQRRAAEGASGGIRPSVFGPPGAPVDLLTLIATLRTAREDPMLGLVLLDVHGLRAGWSRLQSLRRALLALRASGKRVWAYLSDAGMPEYYLASAADRVFLAPTATFDATGLASEVVFLKGAFDKLGIEAQLARAGRFKSAGEPLTRTSMSVEHRRCSTGCSTTSTRSSSATSRPAATSTRRRCGARSRGPLLPAEAVATRPRRPARPIPTSSRTRWRSGSGTPRRSISRGISAAARSTSRAAG